MDYSVDENFTSRRRLTQMNSEGVIVVIVFSSTDLVDFGTMSPSMFISGNSVFAHLDYLEIRARSLDHSVDFYLFLAVRHGVRIEYQEQDS